MRGGRVRLQLIVNPAASGVRPDQVAVVTQALGQGHELSVVETRHRGHAVELARAGAGDGFQAAVVFGGDGTSNEAANGLAGTETALAVLPGGSTNVLARVVGSSRTLRPAVEQLVSALDRPPRRIGLGLANDRYFLFHVGMGFDAVVVREVEKRAYLKRSIGQAAFVLAALTTWLARFDHGRPHLMVSDGDTTVLEDGYLAICQNTQPYTFLGGRPLNLAPDAGWDNALTLTTLRTLDLGTFLPLVVSALGDGSKLRGHPRVDYRSDVRAITVQGVGGHERFSYQADGEYLGETEILRLTYEPDRLLLFTT